jgi:hypothetical protein
MFILELVSNCKEASRKNSVFATFPKKQPQKETISSLLKNTD